MILDKHSISMMEMTAQSLSKLSALRGITSIVEVSADGHYVANGHDCGCSVYGFYDWLNRQPGVKP